MPVSLILWTHALAALTFTVVALSQLRGRGGSVPRLTFLMALSATALWALAVAGIGPQDLVSRVAESGRTLAWLGFMLVLLRRDRTMRLGPAVTVIYSVVGAVALLSVALVLIRAAAPADAPQLAALRGARLAVRMMMAIGALVLVHHLYAVAAPASRGGIRLLVAALALMWGMDLMLSAVAYAFGRPPDVMLAGRGMVMAGVVAPLLAIAVHRNGAWTVRLSRTVAWQSLTLGAVLLYVLVTALAMGAIDWLGGAQARVAQTAFVFGSAAALLTLLSTPALKAWAKVMLAKHLFRHRYDYRVEWTRFTETLGRPGEGAAPLDERIIKAVADLTDSPGGLLLLAEDNQLVGDTSWRWPGPVPALPVDGVLLEQLGASGRIIELDMVRRGLADPAEAAAVPAAMLAAEPAWALVPLVHLNKVTGAILLARPPIARAMDWEDFDLLKIAGRQVASYLAEARARDALAEAQRFDEFNRRFAFILHDIKNLVSQISLVARNAERHADNPAFRADMIATLQESAGRMNELLQRLSQHEVGRAGEPVAVALLPMVERIASRGGGTPDLVVCAGPPVTAVADPVRLEQALVHLVQNAIDASPANGSVELTIDGEGDRALIEIVDHGGGMTPAFVRDQLFRPFASTKAGGFGLGAFEARQLVRAMGGEVEVTTREGEGTRFRVTLPLAPALFGALERAA